MKIEFRILTELNDYPPQTAEITKVVLGESDQGTIEIPDEVEYLGKYYKVVSLDARQVFRGYSKLKKVIFPKYLKKIKSYIFNGHEYELEEVIFRGPTSIEPGCFYSFRKLEKVVWDDKSEIYTDAVQISYDAFCECRNLKKIILHPNTTKIETSSFSKCCSLESITLPYYLKYVDKNIFRDCKELSKLYLLSENLIGLNKTNLLDTLALKTIGREEKTTLSLKSNQYTNFVDLYPLEKIKILDLNVEECGEDLITQCRVIPRLDDNGENTYSGVIVIPKFIWIEDLRYEVNDISDFAFASCPNLEEIKIPRGVKYNRDLAFFNSPNVKILEYE